MGISRWCNFLYSTFLSLECKTNTSVIWCNMSFYLSVLGYCRNNNDIGPLHFRNTTRCFFITCFSLSHSVPGMDFLYGIWVNMCSAVVLSSRALHQVKCDWLSGINASPSHFDICFEAKSVNEIHVSVFAASNHQIISQADMLLVWVRLKSWPCFHYCLDVLWCSFSDPNTMATLPRLTERDMQSSEKGSGNRQ